MNDPKNLRKTKRVKINIPVEIAVQTKSGAKYSGEILDLSIGGAFIRCTAPIDFGQEITVELKVAETRMLHGKVIDNETWIRENAPEVVVGKSVVRWARGSNSSGFGIEFTELTKEEKKFLETLISYCENLDKTP